MSGFTIMHIQKLRNFLFVHCLVLVSVGLAGCSIFLESQELNKTRAALTELESYLPQSSAELQVIGVLSEDFSDRISGTCYYSRDHFIIGSTLQKEEAINLYYRQLWDKGWKSDAWFDKYGGHTSMTLSEWHPTNVLFSDLVDTEARSTYATILVVSIDYVSPGLAEC